MSQPLCIKWPKYWSFSFSICPSNEHSGLIFFRMDWFHLLAVNDCKGTLESLLQYCSSKVSVLQCSTYFMVQFSHLYKTIGKTIALTIQTFVCKVMPLLFNTLSRFVIAFLSRSNLVISCLKDMCLKCNLLLRSLDAIMNWDILSHRVFVKTFMYL